MTIRSYDKNKIKKRISEYEVESRPKLFISGDSAPYYGVIKKALEDSLLYLVENPEDVMIDYDLLMNSGVHVLTELLYVTDGSVSGMKVIDLGCGSTKQSTYFSDRWLPYMSEILTRFGAIVTGIDYRPNNKASYDHQTIDLIRSDRIISGDFDLIIAKSLSDGLVGKSSNQTMEYKILEHISSLLRFN